nr:porin [Sphingopyxis sp.]
PASGFRVGGTTVQISGYLKFDALASSFSGGDPAANSLVNDYYFPSQIPVGGSGEGVNLTSSVRETRLVVRTETPVGDQAVRGHLELDFLDTPLIGNQRVSNSFVPRVRRAFISYGNLTVGQDWSTFQNVAALPERIDFIGPTEGSAFERQPLIRYKVGNITVALENPETTATLGTVSAEADDDVAPDVVLRYDRRLPWGSFAVAAIGRILSVNNSAPPAPLGVPGTIDDQRFGWGISASGVIDRGANRITFMGTVGEGIGRYVGLNLRDDVVINPANGQLDAPLIYAGFVTIRHAFSPRWKAVLTGSAYHSDTPAFASPLLTRSVWSGNIDLLYTPVAPLVLGVGFRFAERQLQSGASGEMRRLQFSAQYNF